MIDDELPLDEEVQRANINAETAKIPWVDLQRFFAAGKTLLVAPNLDLVDVAYAIHRDDASQIKQWQEQSQLDAVSNDQAREWYDNRAEVWAVVIKPWVLVQSIS